ncbi:MAG: hypothetical protein ACFCUQ_19945 [Kiloniellales bacterium]
MRDIAMGCIAAALIAGSAHQAVGQVFEVIHPEVERGRFELEGLNGVVLDDLETGEARSAHEIAIGYAPLSFWKTKIAVEIAKPEGENAEYEAFEWENVILFPFGKHAKGHGHDHGHDHDEFFSFGAAGLYVALEVPNEGGIDSGAIEVGPIVEMSFGPVQVVANLFVEVPFEDDEDPGLSYALSAAIPVAKFEPVALAAGFEAHGGAEGVFGAATPIDDNSHVIGPALYGDIDLGRGRVLEPRVALLFGLTDGSPDTVLSFNIELKF